MMMAWSGRGGRVQDDEDRDEDTVYVGVVGPSGAALDQRGDAEAVGRQLADRSAIVVTGGLGGVMSAASRGALMAGGQTLGLLPGGSRAEANPWLTMTVPTGLGEMRNALLVRCCDAIIAVGCSWGTLSEIALAVRTGVPVFGLGGWELPEPGVVVVESVDEAVRRAVAAARAAR